MAVQKISTAASIYGKPYKWARKITTSTTTTVAVATATSSTFISNSLSLSLTTTSLNSNTITNWRTIAPYALLPYNSNPNSNLLGFSFRGHKRFSILSNSSASASASSSSSSSASSSSSSSKFSGSDSSSAGSGLAADMGSENQKGNVGWYQNNNTNNRHLDEQDRKQQQQQHSYAKLLTLPTILTLGRVAAVPLLICTFYVDSYWGKTATTSIFVAAAVTDWLDGYLARKMKLGSAFGAFLDPVADKLMVAATLVLLCTKPLEVAFLGQMPWLLTVPAVAIIGREITMSAVREWSASQDAKLLEAVAVNNLGKWKTATQMTALTILLATRDSNLAGPGVLVVSGIVLLYISAGLSVWSLAVYMSKIWRVLMK